MADAVVAGESARSIMSMLSRSDTKRTEDGSVDFSLTLSPDECGPVVRAMLRVEAELLIEDADAFVTGHDLLRTPDMRRADALMLLVTRAAEALKRDV